MSQIIDTTDTISSLLDLNNVLNEKECNPFDREPTHEELKAITRYINSLKEDM